MARWRSSAASSASYSATRARLSCSRTLACSSGTSTCSAYARRSFGGNRSWSPKYLSSVSRASSRRAASASTRSAGAPCHAEVLSTTSWNSSNAAARCSRSRRKDTTSRASIFGLLVSSAARGGESPPSRVDAGVDSATTAGLASTATDASAAAPAIATVVHAPRSARASGGRGNDDANGRSVCR